MKSHGFDIDDTTLVSLLNGSEHDIAMAFEAVRKRSLQIVPQFLRINRSSHDYIDELIAESFTALYHNVTTKTYESRASLLTYYLAILKKKHFKRVRTNRLALHTISLEEVDESISILSSKQEQEVELLLEQEQMVRHLTRQLTPKCRAIIYQYYWLERSHKQIADDLGYSSAATVKAQKYRCIRYLHNIYNSTTDAE